MLVIASVPLTTADTASGSAGVSNVAPEIISVTDNASGGTVDPESYFWVNVRVRDNNTLADIDNVIVKVYENSLADTDADDKENHYTFWFDPSDNTWHSSLTNTQGSAFIGTGTYPSDLTATTDNYNFKILINGTASHVNDWDVWAKVEDEAASDNSETANDFDVNKYVSYSLGVSTLEWSGLSVPSENNACDNNTDNPIVTSIETNVSYDVQHKVTDWTYSGNTIGADNTSWNTTASPDGTTMSNSFQNAYTNESEGEAVTKNIYYYLDIPTGTPDGTYTSTFTIEVAEA
jgi:hypothetical protein